MHGAGFSKEQCSSLKMILESKHVGAILNVLMEKNYVCAQSSKRFSRWIHQKNTSIACVL